MMSKDNVIIVTISTVIGALLIGVFSPVFSPLSEAVKDQISGEPNATIIAATTFDKDNKDVTKQVKNHDIITSNSIRFDFDASQRSPFIQPPKPNGFQCSLDGAPFEDCVPPKSYGDLPTEVGHTFQVRAVGILGNIDKSPVKYYFTTITSASVEGIVKGNGSPEVGAPIALHYNLTRIMKLLEHEGNLDKIKQNSDPNLRTTETDSMGRFQFEGLGQGSQYFVINSTSENKPMRDSFFISAGEQIKEFDFEIRNMSPVAIKLPDGNITDPGATNPEFIGSKGTTELQNYTVDLAQESKLTQQAPNELFTKIWLNASDSVLSKIENVTYYLHPTFNPSVITSYTKENKFIITFTNWGKFDLKAKAYFEDGTVKDLRLSLDEWKVPQVLPIQTEKITDPQTFNSEFRGTNASREPINYIVSLAQRSELIKQE
ncbi:MAG: pYEATS domain-containing protein, partial [Nitrososphaeraceae archaeon]